MTDKLKPCPFCGGEASCVGDLLPNNTDVYYIECLECGANSDLYGTEEKAIKAWNTRKPMDRIVEQLEDASCYIEDGDGHAGHLIFTDAAIEIVKAGGMDE